MSTQCRRCSHRYLVTVVFLTHVPRVSITPPPRRCSLTSHSLGMGWIYDFFNTSGLDRASVDSGTSLQIPAYPGGDHQTHWCHVPPHLMWQAFTFSVFFPQICIIKLIIEIRELRGVQTSQRCRRQEKELLQIGEKQEDGRTNMLASWTGSWTGS